MIDRSKRYWTGDSPADIEEWLRLYVPEETLDIKPVVCHGCGGDVFRLRVDQDEGVIQVVCTACGAKKILLDGEDYWADARPRLRRCPVCKSCRDYNVDVGFARRKNGSVKWVYIVNRCTGCGTLGSYLDWKVDYEPTDGMERNI